MVQIIYIAGYGRSGSTILDLILGVNNNIFSTGELATLFSEVLSSANCSCGNKYTSNCFWAEYINQFPDDKLHSYQDIIIAAEQRMLFKNRSCAREDEYVNLVKSCFDYIKQKKTVKYIVDSSKTTGVTARRALLLSQHVGMPIKVIHIEKNIIDLLHSLRKGSNRIMAGKPYKYIPFIQQLFLSKTNKISVRKTNLSSVHFICRGFVGWFMANQDARKLKSKIGTKNYFHINFRNLMQNPLDIIDQLSIFLNISLDESKKIIRNNTSIPVGHIIGGNRLATMKGIYFNKKEE